MTKNEANDEIRENMARIEISVKVKEPKENAPKYRIRTVGDMLAAVNGKNVDKFMKEFEIVFRSMVLVNDMYELSGKGEKPLEFDGFDWIDD